MDVLIIVRLLKAPPVPEAVLVNGICVMGVEQAMAKSVQIAAVADAVGKVARITFIVEQVVVLSIYYGRITTSLDYYLTLWLS